MRLYMIVRMHGCRFLRGSLVMGEGGGGGGGGGGGRGMMNRSSPNNKRTVKKFTPVIVPLPPTKVMKLFILYYFSLLFLFTC